jgi:tetratricopeptide (TPR) repeat protein
MQYIDEILKAIESMDYECALELIEAHRAEHGFEPEFITAQAILCIQTQEFEVACDILLDGVAKHPQNADLLYNLGYTYHCMTNGEQALDCYKRAMELADNTDFIEELIQLCADIESSSRVLCFNNEADCSHNNVSIISQNELKSLNYDIDLSIVTREKVRFLLRRLEFGIEADKAGNVLSAALSTGCIDKEDFKSIIASSWVDKSRLNDFADIIDA